MNFNKMSKIKSVIKSKKIVVSAWLIPIVTILFVDGFKIPNPAIVCLISVVFTTFVGGFLWGIYSGVIIFLYCCYFFSINHNFIDYTSNNQDKIIVIFFSYIVTIIMVGILEKKVACRTKKLNDLNEVLFQMSITDELTDVGNFRYFDAMSKKAWNICVREQQAITIALMDIDFFKNYNDMYGHYKGNECLIQIGDIIKSNMQQEGDIIARYGGEEFVIVLPNTDSNEALQRMEQIRKKVELQKIIHEASDVIPYVTLSIGLATIIPNQKDELEGLIKKADQALYQAKSEGKNRVKVYKDIDESN